MSSKKRALHSSLVVTFVLLITSCLTGPVAGDREPPRLLEVTPSLGTDVSPTVELRLRFDEALDPASLRDAIVLVPFELGAACTVDLSCPGGRCVFGRCQRDPVDAAFLRDLAKPPLSSSRQGLVASVSVAPGPDDHVVVLRLRRPLVARRLHALLVAPTVTDQAGNPLADEPLRRDFATGDAALGRPVLELLSPRAGATELPTNLARLIVRASQPLQGVGPGAWWLESPSGERVDLEAEPADDVCMGIPGMPRCLRLRPRRAFTPLTEWSLQAASSVRNGRGDPLFVGEAPRFGTGARADHEPPTASYLDLRVADGCLLISAQVDEDSDLRVRSSWSADSSLSVGARSYQVGTKLPAPLAGAVSLELSDLAGNHQQPLVRLVDRPAVPPVVITEVLPNPRGLEPAQEWVELYNASGAPVALGGWLIDDGDDGVGVNVLPDVELAAGAFAVVVGARFDSSSPLDPAPAPDALLIRLEGTLGALGLANSGEKLVLRDARGVLVSSYGGFLAVQGDSFAGRSIARVDVRACDLPASWRVVPHAPTPGTAVFAP